MIDNTNLFSGPYPTTGGINQFPVTFTFLENSDLVVLLISLTTGAITTLALTTDYTVTGAGVPNGGQITTTVTYLLGSTIVIVRGMAYVQDTNLGAQGTFNFAAPSINAQLDYITLLVQQLAEQLGRCFKTAPGTQPAAYLQPATTTSISNVISFPVNHPTIAGCQIVAVSDGWAFNFNGVTVLHVTANGIVP